MSQILNLNENELDVLARFMGHDIKVHRKYYRLPDFKETADGFVQTFTEMFLGWSSIRQIIFLPRDGNQS